MNIFLYLDFFWLRYFVSQKNLKTFATNPKKRTINAHIVRLRSYVVNDRTKLNTISQLTKRAKSALCNQIERKTKKKHQNIWFVCGKLRTFVSNQSGKNNLKNF